MYENVVFLKLRRERKKIYYWKSIDEYEVDFVVTEGVKIKELIQVTYASGKDEIREREIKALKKAGKELNCKDLIVITWDYEEEGEIKYIPLWKWLLKKIISIS